RGDPGKRYRQPIGDMSAFGRHCLLVLNPSGDRLSDWQDVQLVERGVERRFVRDHGLDRLDLDDARRLDDRGDERGGDIGRDRRAAFRRALGRQPIEAKLAQPVVQPLVVGKVRGVDAHQLGKPFGTGHEADHVLGRVVRVDHERAAGRHPAHVIPAFDHRLLDEHDDIRLLVLVGERVFDHALAEAAILAGRRVRAIRVVDVVFHRLGELALEPSGGRDRIDDVAALLVHDDAACPHGELGVTHVEAPLSSTWNRLWTCRTKRSKTTASVCCSGWSGGSAAIATSVRSWPASTSRIVPRFVCSMAQPSLLTAVTAMLSVSPSLSHGTTSAVTLPWPRAYSSIARDTTCGDPVAVNVTNSLMRFGSMLN